MISSTLRNVARTVDGIGTVVTAPFTDPVVRLGVTGLSRAGKTVFITSLVANLLNRARMPQFLAATDGTIQSVYLQPQPDDTIARFDYEANLDALLGPKPAWPHSTTSISELRLSFRIQPRGLLSGLSGPKTLHLDIVDYPGEWLLDLALLDMDYEAWSAHALSLAECRPQGRGFLDELAALDENAKFDDVTAKALAATFASYLGQAREDGFSDCTPGRFLLPGELAGSPVLTFVPMPLGAAPRGSLRREMARRFAAYKAKVVMPFFRDHFSKIDRQVVLIDALKALSDGPAALMDLEQAMAHILQSFRPGQNSILSTIFQGRRVEKILFAATKADHLHHEQHPALMSLIGGLVQGARDRADFSGAQTSALALSALRTTVEAKLEGGQPAVQGTLQETGRATAFYPGALPQSPSGLFAQARSGAATWEGGGFAAMRFAPSVLSLQPNEGPPHIRLDKAVQFLLGDAL